MREVGVKKKKDQWVTGYGKHLPNFPCLLYGNTNCNGVQQKWLRHFKYAENEPPPPPHTPIYTNSSYLWAITHKPIHDNGELRHSV